MKDLIFNFKKSVFQIEMFLLIKFIQTDDVVDSTLARTWQSAGVLSVWKSVKLSHFASASANISATSTNSNVLDQLWG